MPVTHTSPTLRSDFAGETPLFGRPLELDKLRRKLVQHGLKHRDHARRVRVPVSQMGRIYTGRGPLELSVAPFTAALAKKPANSQDVFLFHTTTYRATHDLRRRDAPNAAAVLPYNERGELTEFTVGNLVLELNGELLTLPRKAAF